ncbi:hypothetical protein BXO88_04130 [Oribacterium sp. C9]|nr:hypothetical protein BXO88_04130 [Oribacterium sp. C9]
MDRIEFYCKQCKKSMKMYYIASGVKDTPVMNGVIIRCRTHKCTRTLEFKNFTEHGIIKMSDNTGRCYL